MRNYRWGLQGYEREWTTVPGKTGKRLIIMLVRRDLKCAGKLPGANYRRTSHVRLPFRASCLMSITFRQGNIKTGSNRRKDNVFCTMTASGSEYFYGIDGRRYRPFMKDRLVLTELEGLNLGRNTADRPEEACGEYGPEFHLQRHCSFISRTHISKG
jgi:hypothetical protein